MVLGSHCNNRITSYNVCYTKLLRDLTYLLNKPEAINDVQTASLEAVMQQFPYFQAARALYLKGLYNNQNFRYNYELKKTAAYTTDRSILFDFITSEKFSTLQKQNIEQQLNAIEDRITSYNVCYTKLLRFE